MGDYRPIRVHPALRRRSRQPAQNHNDNDNDNALSAYRAVAANLEEHADEQRAYLSRHA